MIEFNSLVLRIILQQHSGLTSVAKDFSHEAAIIRKNRCTKHYFPCRAKIQHLYKLICIIHMMPFPAEQQITIGFEWNYLIILSTIPRIRPINGSVSILDFKLFVSYRNKLKCT